MSESKFINNSIDILSSSNNLFHFPKELDYKKMSNYLTNYSQSLSRGAFDQTVMNTFAFGSGSRGSSLGVSNSSGGGNITVVSPLTALYEAIRKTPFHTETNGIFSKRTHHASPSTEEFILDISCGESISGFLTSHNRVFIAGEMDSTTGMYTCVDLSMIKEKEGSCVVRQVAVGSSLFCIVTENGTVWTSMNRSERLQRLYFEKSQHDRTVDLSVKIKYVSCGLSHIMALSENNEVYAAGFTSYGCSGANTGSHGSYSQYRNGVKVDIPLVPGDEVRDVYAAYYRTLIVSKMGYIYTTGWGVYHQQVGVL